MIGSLFLLSLLLERLALQHYTTSLGLPFALVFLDLCWNKVVLFKYSMHMHLIRANFIYNWHELCEGLIRDQVWCWSDKDVVLDPLALLLLTHFLLDLVQSDDLLPSFVDSDLKDTIIAIDLRKMMSVLL